MQLKVIVRKHCFIKMEFDKETQEKIKEMQMYEQNLNNLLMQKQVFQMELIEAENALSELGKANDEVYKIFGNIMIKSNNKKIQEELEKRKDLVNLRLKSIEKQENTLTQQAEELRNEVLKKIK